MRVPSVLFVLPAPGASGGANSVVQECLALGRLGVKASVAVDRANAAAFLANYPELARCGRPARTYASVDDLAELGREHDVLCATINHTVATLAAARERAEFRIAYYVQDYEPLFYEPGSEAWRTARDSYALVADAVLFAKTRWIARIVEDNHGVRVSKVEPGLDHEVFYPALRRPHGGVSITAMLRPQTPRRAPIRTLRILHALRERYGDEVQLQVFGAEPRDLEVLGLALPRGAANHGELRRTDVAHLLRQTDLFLDLSDYQGFGRTALEGMACGATPIVPALGGADEYARHGENAFVVDTRSDAAILDAVTEFLAADTPVRDAWTLSALETAAAYSTHRAALSQLGLFKAMLD